MEGWVVIPESQLPIAESFKFDVLIKVVIPPINRGRPHGGRESSFFK